MVGLNIVAPVLKFLAVVYGSGDLALEHTPNEHIHLNEHKKALDVLSEVLNKLMK